MTEAAKAKTTPVAWMRAYVRDMSDYDDSIYGAQEYIYRGAVMDRAHEEVRRIYGEGADVEAASPFAVLHDGRVIEVIYFQCPTADDHWEVLGQKLPELLLARRPLAVAWVQLVLELRYDDGVLTTELWLEGLERGSRRVRAAAPVVRALDGRWHAGALQRLRDEGGSPLAWYLKDVELAMGRVPAPALLA